MDLDHARTVAVEAAEAAGALVLAGTRGALGVRAKGGSGDVVTDLDLASEKLLLERILTAFPSHTVIAEESGLVGAAGGEWTWLVDPLDGTNNVAIGLPAYVVGVALCRGRRPVVGVVHDPVSARTWSAVRGRGARSSAPGSPTAVRLASPYAPRPHGPLLAWTQGYGVSRDDATARALTSAMELRARRVLRLWAPLLSWAMLARGDIDGIVGYRAEAVDLPAGALLAMEAGIEIRALDGGPFEECFDGTPDDRSFVAAHPRALPGLLDLLR
ncbi:inositol monophosphatase [Nonomuraea phyllanthi]|uniref:Inositol monophosphatase n=1 Tax=Nonomuraea phyllanthi TaxID=2219224 RepID=A0A5C4VST8_9ACTN|nr:inositol monophosphatase family protein [Nonomuraea phyllanthi]KAB8189964.1 inositol monophosphatase [Nonomuraea phyllanthi]QFY08455.1 inositol monophosphatase [Nonomuraea phyllanthi]